jgi:hypothetical protein
MPPANENFNNASNYDIMSQFGPSNLDRTLDFDTMPVPPTADHRGPWGYNTGSAAANQDSSPDILGQFFDNFPASTNGI